MYQWGGGAYASSVYTALTDESNPQEELKKLEEIVQNPEGKRFRRDCMLIWDYCTQKLVIRKKHLVSIKKKRTLSRISTIY